MTEKTPLHTAHLKANARMVNFAGWEMPLHYGSQIQEHHSVRKNAGVFDVSHMAILDFCGPDALKLLQSVLSTDISRLAIHAGRYGCLLNPEGGVKDDLIAYRLSSADFRLVVNASTRDKDIAWFRAHAKNHHLKINIRTDLAMLAIQGPTVPEKISAIFPKKMRLSVSSLKPFCVTPHDDWLIARTGYTGEEGFEVMLPADTVSLFWQTLLAAGIQPCGLGARDTLRLEAGLNLYGADMDETTSPLISGLAWTVDLDQTERDFIGRKALLDQRKAGIKEKRVGILADARTILRNHQTVEIPENDNGIITSGSFSPTLGVGIALARVPTAAGVTCDVTVRGKKIPARIIRPPFIRHGKHCF